MLCINNYHWIWYFLGFLFSPRLTIMIMLSIHAESLHIPLSLMILGWIVAIVSLFGGNKND